MKCRTLVRTLLLLLAGGLAACDSPAAPRRAEVLAVRIDTAGGPLIRTAHVTLSAPAKLVLTWGAQNTPVLTLETEEPQLEHAVVLPRLRAERDYTLQVRPLGAPSPAPDAHFRTGALPAAVAALEFRETGTPTRPVSMIEMVGGSFLGLLMVEQGEVVWYYRTTASLFGAARRANGDIVMLDGNRGLVSIRPDGTEAHQLQQPDSAPGAAYGQIHHDVTATPANTLLFIANDTRVVDGTSVLGEALWEWNPEAGTVVKRWSAFDHLDWNTERGFRSTAGNWLHGNGVSYGARGNILMSARNADLVISIAPDFSRVEWRLGGANSTLQVAAGDRFLGQHYVTEPAPGRVLLFDNGYERPGVRFSRAIEFAIDTVTKRATKVWEYRRTPEIYAALVGSARRLPNGNTVILFGMHAPDNESTGPIVGVEVDAAGTERWRIEPNEAVRRLYRLTPLASVAGEKVGAFSY